MGDMLLGRRPYWPIYAAAEKHGLAIGIHAGSTYRHAPMASGWPAHRVEDYVAQSAAFESQLLSFLAEGVFQQFPALRVVLIESGFTWLPNLLWRTSKSWRGMRAEVPWIDRPPADIVLRESSSLITCGAGRCAGRRPGAGAHPGTHRFRPHAAVLDRLSALAFRRRRRAAGRAVRRNGAAHADRQSARNLYCFRTGYKSAIMPHHVAKEIRLTFMRFGLKTSLLSFRFRRSLERGRARGILPEASARPGSVRDRVRFNATAAAKSSIATSIRRSASRRTSIRSCRRAGAST